MIPRNEASSSESGGGGGAVKWGLGEQGWSCM